MTYSVSPAMADPGLIPWLERQTLPPGCESLMVQWWLWHSGAPENYVEKNRYPAITRVTDWCLPTGVGYEAGNPGDADQVSGRTAVKRWRDIEPLLPFTPEYLTIDEPCAHLQGGPGWLQKGIDSVIRVSEELGFPLSYYEPYPLLSAQEIHIALVKIQRHTSFVKEFILDINTAELMGKHWKGDRWLHDIDFLRQACENLGIRFGISITGQKARWDEPFRHIDSSFMARSEWFYEIVQDRANHFTLEGGWEDSPTGVRDVPSTPALLRLAEKLFLE